MNKICKYLLIISLIINIALGYSLFHLSKRNVFLRTYIDSEFQVGDSAVGKAINTVLRFINAVKTDNAVALEETLYFKEYMEHLEDLISFMNFINDNIDITKIVISYPDDLSKHHYTFDNVILLDFYFEDLNATKLAIAYFVIAEYNGEWLIVTFDKDTSSGGS